MDLVGRFGERGARVEVCWDDRVTAWVRAGVGILSMVPPLSFLVGGIIMDEGGLEVNVNVWVLFKKDWVIVHLS
jgi:hypothetical protein